MPDAQGYCGYHLACDGLACLAQSLAPSRRSAELPSSWWGWVSSRSAPPYRLCDYRGLPRLLQPFTYEVGTNSEYWPGCPKDSWAGHRESNYCLFYFFYFLDLPGGSDGEASAYNAGDLGSIPGSGRSPGEGNGNPLQYSCLENPVDRGYPPLASVPSANGQAERGCQPGPQDLPDLACDAQGKTKRWPLPRRPPRPARAPLGGRAEPLL